MGRAIIHTLKLCVLGLFAAGVITSCAARNPTFSSLANQGIVPVSADSPFVGSNVYLAKEMEDSLYLYNFLRSRGSPRAIEIAGPSEYSAELSLYYPREKEVYRATPFRDPHTKAKEWVIKGPFAFERGQHREIASLDSETTGVFEIFGRREVFGGDSVGMPQRVIEPAYVPTPMPTPRPKVMRKRPAQQTPVGPAISIQGTPVNLDQEALAEMNKPRNQDAIQTPPNAQSILTPKAESSQKSGAIDDALHNTVTRSENPKPSTAPSKVGRK